MVEKAFQFEVNQPGEINFDDDQHPVGVVEFDYAAVDGEAETDAPVDSVSDARLVFDRRQAICGLLALLTAGDATAQTIGARALLLAVLVKAGTGHQTQREIAKRLHITPGRLSQIKREFLRNVPDFIG